MNTSNYGKSSLTFKALLALIFIMTLTTRCKQPFLKDKLRGEPEILVGTWNWSHSYCYYDLTNPDSVGYTAKLHFDPSGVMTHFVDGNAILVQDIYIDQFYAYDDTSYEFFFEDENENVYMQGVVSQNYIRLWDFPLDMTECWGVWDPWPGNYFVRE